MDSSSSSPTGHRCLSRQRLLTSQLRPLSIFDLGKAATCLRQFFSSRNFNEVILDPFDAYPIDYRNDVVDVPGIGQLRFNTEPTIWAASHYTPNFYSITPLFRNESETNPLRGNAFFVVDFYQHGTPNSLLTIFRDVLGAFADQGFATQLFHLAFADAQYDPSIDGPAGTPAEAKWVVTKGYGPAHSFYEVDGTGRSTRQELFLVTPQGHLEVGAFGITGWNNNPDYLPRATAAHPPNPNLGISGMCFGLERLLLAEQILSLLKSA